MKWVVIIGIVAILISLFSALFAIIRDKDSTQVAKKLTVRITLSLLLFILLMILFYTGNLTPHQV